MPYFKKYQFPELEGDSKKSLFDTLRLGERTQSLLECKEEALILQNKKITLIDNVQEQFDALRNREDLAILYEITGFQGEIPYELNADFWDNYVD